MAHSGVSLSINSLLKICEEDMSILAQMHPLSDDYWNLAYKIRAIEKKVDQLLREETTQLNSWLAELDRFFEGQLPLQNPLLQISNR